MFELTHPGSEAGGRAESDHYPTPPLLAKRGVQLALELHGLRAIPLFLVEPGCGDRAPFCRWALDAGMVARGIEARDIDPPTFPDIAEEQVWEGFRFSGGADYLTMEKPDERADLIVTNPPFSLAEEFVRRAIEKWVTPTGLVVMLLKTSFEASNDRREFWRKHPAIFRYVIRPRPGFTGSGNDSGEYAFFVWPGPALGRKLSRIGRAWCETRYIDNDGPWRKA